MKHTTRLAGLTLVATAAVVVPGTSPSSAATTCTIDQVTESTGDGNWANLSPAISRDGAYIVFSSSRDYTGNNADANNEIVRYEVATGASGRSPRPPWPGRSATPSRRSTTTATAWPGPPRP